MIMEQLKSPLQFPRRWQRKHHESLLWLSSWLAASGRKKTKRFRSIYPGILILLIFRCQHTSWRFTMNSLPMTINTDLITRLKAVGLRATAANFDDLLARASKQRWS